MTALHTVLDKPGIRLLGNIGYGTDVKLDDLREFYGAVIFATGATSDRAPEIPGVDLPGSFGAADFVSWYDGHPDVPRTWPLEATSIAVLGVGNVALDVARILVKTADELLTTDIPPNVYEGLKAKFTPLELRELDHSPNVEVIVPRRTSSSTREASRAAFVQAGRDHREDAAGVGDPRPGRPAEAAAPALLPLAGQGARRGPATATSAAPVSSTTGTCRPSTARSATCPRRWPSSRSTTRTKGYAAGTVANLLADADSLDRPKHDDPDAILGFLTDRGVPFTTWEGWGLLDAHERSLGEPQGRERV